MSQTARADFSPATATALRLAALRMRQAEHGNTHQLYEACRSALTYMSGVDGCYVGHFRGAGRLVIPYAYDRGVPQPPEVMFYGEFGLSHWLRTWRKTYTYAQDQGVLARAGRSASEDDVELDVVVAPLLDADGATVGMLAATSHTPARFSQETVAAVEWLARHLQRALDRDLDEVTDLELVASRSDAAMDRNADVVHAIALRLSCLGQRVQGVTQSLGAGAPTEALEELAAIEALCARYTTELALIATSPRAGNRPSTPLTAREAAITELIAQQGLSNADIARQLRISEKTVKTHLSHVFQKLGVSQRSELQYLPIESPRTFAPYEPKTGADRRVRSRRSDS